MKNWIIIILSFLTISCSSQNNKDIDWKEDIDFLKKELPKRHKNLFFKISKSDFENQLEKIKIQNDSLSNFETALKLQQVIANIGDSHTSIILKKYINPKKLLPLRFYWFSDGIFIKQTTENYRELLGRKITSINGHSISKIADSLSSLITVDNNAIVKNKIPKLLFLTQLLDYFKFSTNNTYEIEVETPQGIKSTHKIKPYTVNTQKLISIPINNIAYCWQNQRISFTENFIKKDNIYYLQYNQCSKKSKVPNKKNDIISFDDYKKQVFKTIKKEKPNKLIFDMRFNGGGGSAQGTRFIKQLAEFKDINQKGKLFVIIGRRTFSSAIINTMDFIKNTNAFIVGETTGGKPNHYGEIRSFKLPNSKLKVIYSTKYFNRIKKEMNTITPDIEIETFFNDYINGIDPVYEWIKKQ